MNAASDTPRLEAEPDARPATTRLVDWWESYWYEPVDMTRLRYFTRIVFAALLYTIWKVDYWGPTHAWAPEGLYQPIGIARLLNIGPPTETTMAILQTVLTGGLVAGIAFARPSEAAWNRIAARASNIVVFFAFGLWNIWSFSWSKVDHDRLVPTVAIAVLCIVPAVGSGTSRNVGWALRTIQVILVLTYPLSAISKLQKSGWFWLNSAVFSRAIIRRGTEFGEFLINHPALLRIGQWGFFFFEAISVLALSRNVWIRRLIVPGFFALHLFTYFAIGIHFLPHSICLVAFLPLERLRSLWTKNASPEGVTLHV